MALGVKINIEHSQTLNIPINSRVLKNGVFKRVENARKTREKRRKTRLCVRFLNAFFQNAFICILIPKNQKKN
jgi:hypothetical protein